VANVRADKWLGRPIYTNCWSPSLLGNNCKSHRNDHRIILDYSVLARKADIKCFKAYLFLLFILVAGCRSLKAILIEKEPA